MPTLPASGYATPQAPSIDPLPVAPELKQDIRATPEAFGFESARALTNLGTSFEKVATNLASIQDQYDTVVAREARNRALDYSQQRLYGDKDWFFGTEGRAALDRRDSTLKELNNVYAKERANLPTAQAQRLFDEGSAASRLHNNALVLQHANKEFQRYRAKEAESEVGLKLNEVSSASTRGDLDAMKQNLGEAINIATQALRERGASDAEIKAKASDLTATAVEFWSLGRAPTDPVGALAALEENKEYFTDPARYARLYGQVKGHADKEAGRKLVESTTGPGGPTGGASASGKEHYDYQRSIGASHNEAVVLTAGAEVESNFNPEAKHDEKTLAAKGLPPGYGMYGHNDKRLAEMQKQFGPRPTWQQQAQFALQELRSRPEGARVNAAKTAEELTDIQLDYESPARTPEGYQKRLAATRRYMTNTPSTGAQPPTQGDTSSPWAPTTGPDGKTYMLTGPQAEQYKSIEKPEDQQKFLTEAVKTPVPPGATAPQGIPESPLAGQVARIQASGATPEVKEAAIAELHRQHTTTTMGQDEAKYELTKAIVRDDPSITPEYIDTLVKGAKISPAAGTEALNLLGKVQDERKARAEAIVRVEAAGAGGAPLDPKSTTDKKALDYHYEVKSATWPREEALPRSIAYAAQYGMVPERLRAFIRGGLHSARPDLAVQAANTITTLRNSNPELVAEIGDEADMRLANLINTYASAGMAPDKAVELATESLKVTPAIREARAAEYDLRGKTPKERSDSDEKWISNQNNSWWPGDPNIDPMMRTEFSETAKAEFQRTGNLEASRRMALDTVNRVWGRSEVGGDRRYVKQSPEKFYSIPTLTPAENSRWMNEQLLSDVGKGALQSPSNPITSDRLRLIPDPTRTNGGNPVYQVWLVQPDAGWQQVVDTKGAPIRWHPDYSTSADRKRRDDASAAEIERARTLRKEQGEREQLVPTR